ncbi:hypothetical protein [Streptomyces uncialis]|uniref:hypothetical protein n=1 Tax=Streptomyces uncialis TaxID=1048205 RepID=UPI0034118B9A
MTWPEAVVVIVVIAAVPALVSVAGLLLPEALLAAAGAGLVAATVIWIIRPSLRPLRVLGAALAPSAI